MKKYFFASALFGLGLVFGIGGSVIAAGGLPQKIYPIFSSSTSLSALPLAFTNLYGRLDYISHQIDTQCGR